MYEAVLAAKEAVEKEMRPGQSWIAMHELAERVLAQVPSHTYSPISFHPYMPCSWSHIRCLGALPSVPPAPSVPSVPLGALRTAYTSLTTHHIHSQLTHPLPLTHIPS